MRKFAPCLLAVSAVLTLSPLASGQETTPSYTLQYQGLLTDPLGTPVADGEYDLTFRFYPSATGGTALWTEPQTVQVRRGVFHTVLGHIEPIPASIDFSRALWLSIRIEGSGELSPRFALSGTPYALFALAVPDSSIGASKLAAGSVHGTALAAQAVTRDKIAAGSIDSSRVADGALSGRNLAPASVRPSRIDLSDAEEGQTLVVVQDSLVWAGSATSGGIGEVIAGPGLSGGGAGLVVTLRVAEGGIQSAMLAPESVVAEKMARAAVETVHLASGAVTSVKLANGAVGTTQLATGAVTTPAIAPEAVTTTRIADGAVTAAKLAGGIEFLADGSVTTPKLADGAVTAAKIANQNVGTAKIDPAGGTNGDVLAIQGNRVVWASPRTLTGQSLEAYASGSGPDGRVPIAIDGASAPAAAQADAASEGDAAGPSAALQAAELEIAELRTRLARSERDIQALTEAVQSLQQELGRLRSAAERQ